jgi:hypothetical protein
VTAVVFGERMLSNNSWVVTPKDVIHKCPNGTFFVGIGCVQVLSLRVCVCVCVCVCARARLCMHTCINTCMHTYVHKYIHTYVYIVYIHTHICNIYGHGVCVQCPANATSYPASVEKSSCRCDANFYLEVVNEDWVCSRCLSLPLSPSLSLFISLSRSLARSLSLSLSLSLYIYKYIYMGLLTVAPPLSV